jgi:hypothetical protein
MNKNPVPIINKQSTQLFKNTEFIFDYAGLSEPIRPVE